MSNSVSTDVVGRGLRRKCACVTSDERCLGLPGYVPSPVPGRAQLAACSLIACSTVDGVYTSH